MPSELLRARSRDRKQLTEKAFVGLRSEEVRDTRTISGYKGEYRYDSTKSYACLKWGLVNLRSLKVTLPAGI
eukprot:3477436-Rhodomonas_salina.2